MASGFVSFLTAVGSDVKKVFSWIGSPKGQAIIATGEGVAEAVDPGLTPIITLANTWITEAVKTEAIATAAAATTGSSTQKAAATITAVSPAILQFAQQEGLVTTPTAAQIEAANTAIVAFLNAFGTTTTAPAA